MSWYLVEVSARAASPCLLAGWSGSFAYRAFLELVRRAAEPKGRIYAHPLYVGGRPLLSGVDGSAAALEPGRRFSLKAVMSEHDLRLLLAAASGDKVLRSTCEAELEEIKFEALPEALGDGHGLASAKLEFSPTAFMFHGRDVLYPSPQRMAYSLAKTYKELYGRDLKQLADRAPTALEVVYMAVRPVKVNIGESRAVPAFVGRAELAIYGNVEAWLTLLKLGEAVGVGISRAIGLGKYRILEVKRLA